MFLDKRAEFVERDLNTGAWRLLPQVRTPDQVEMVHTGSGDDELCELSCMAHRTRAHTPTLDMLYVVVGVVVCVAASSPCLIADAFNLMPGSLWYFSVHGGLFEYVLTPAPSSTFEPFINERTQEQSKWRSHVIAQPSPLGRVLAFLPPGASVLLSR